LGALVLSLLGIVLGAAHRLGPITPEDVSAFFRLLVAVSVLPLGWNGMPLAGFGSRAPASDVAAAARAPFPLHLAALPGMAAVLWLFRLIGLLWLFQGARHFFERGF
jgi:hypothetical protein